MAETTDLLGFAVEKSPVDFADTLNQLLSQKAQERVEAHRVTLAQSIYSDTESDDVEDTDDEDFDDADDDLDFDDDELEDLDDDDLDIDDLDDLDLEDLDLDDDNEDFTDDEDA
jgi:ribonuclease E